MDQQDEVILRVAARVRQGLERHPLHGLLVFREGVISRIDDSLPDLTSAGVPLSLVLADLDHFKRINDLHGHLVGDGLLAAVGQLLRDLVRPLDLVLASGGDAYLLVLLGADLDVAAARAETARQRLAALELPDVPHRITASFGVVTHDGSEAAVELFDRGFEAEFRAKALGRDRVEVASAAS